MYNAFMRLWGKSSNAYFDELEKRSKKSRAFHKHQLIGLMMAEILGDSKHKSLYIKLAKKHDAQTLLELAKNIASKKNIKNRGAYFMRVFYSKAKK